MLVGTKGRVIRYSVFVNEQARGNKESLITTVFSGATHLETFICFFGLMCGNCHVSLWMITVCWDWNPMKPFCRLQKGLTLAWYEVMRFCCLRSHYFTVLLWVAAIWRQPTFQDSTFCLPHMAMPFLEPPSVDHITVTNKLIMRDALPGKKRL